MNPPRFRFTIIGLAAPKGKKPILRFLPRFNEASNFLDTGKITKQPVFVHLEYLKLDSCPLSIKNAPVVDYKNINLLKRYISENHKILSSKITSVSSGKQKKLTKEINKAKVLGLV